MKVTESTARKLVISDLKDMDPLTVFLEDFRPGQGQITITSFGDTWSNYWSHMGETNTLTSFFLSCDEHYLAKKLSNVKRTVYDDSKIIEAMKKEIISRRLDGDIEKVKARELWDSIYLFNDSVNPLEMDSKDRQFLEDVFGQEWYYCLPEKPNYKYEYLCNVIKTVQEALKEIEHEPQNG